MKLMTNVAKRDPRSNSPCAKPPGPSVAGARSSSTRIVIAMANTPSTSVSRRFFGSPWALVLADSVYLPRGRDMGPDLKTSALTIGTPLRQGRTGDRSHRRGHRVDEPRVGVRRFRALELKTSLRSERPGLDVHIVEDLQVVRDESEWNHEDRFLTGSADLVEDFLERWTEPRLLAAARTLPRDPDPEGRQLSQHKAHRLGQLPFVRVPVVHDLLRQAVRRKHDGGVVEASLCQAP